ncbi:GGDEF domain-containing protein [Bacillus sp. 7884-1]|uniref:GGDEF domain-containing protein n=1 Tax=Bacillus sp. 7884-1 TaxID=2021693 RepID=UPI0015C6B235|nr:GGDEF domain-containing protein [Bacillus sp. 7884-1]
MMMQLTLSFLISYTVGLMSKRLKKNKLKLEQAYENIEKMAYYDPLTGAANRCMLLKTIDVEIQRHKKNKSQFSVLFLDLDGFKQVNDEFGHDAGDIVLIEVVQRLKNCLREKDLLARFAGDEFIILIPQVSHLETVRIAGKLLKVIQTPFIINHNKVNLSTSIGITFSNNGVDTSSSLIKQADMPMYEAKKLGKNNYQVYYPTLKQVHKDLGGISS